MKNNDKNKKSELGLGSHGKTQNPEPKVENTKPKS
jgi:hypothetical protein